MDAKSDTLLLAIRTPFLFPDDAQNIVTFNGPENFFEECSIDTDVFNRWIFTLHDKDCLRFVYLTENLNLIKKKLNFLFAFLDIEFLLFFFWVNHTSQLRNHSVYPAR